MFGWFKRKPELPRYEDCVWLDEAARLAALVRLARAGKPVLFLSFFEESEGRVDAALRAAGVEVARGTSPTTARIRLVRASSLRSLFSDPSEDTEVVFIEHHPLLSENRAVLEALQQHTRAVPTFHSALDEPLLGRFGGERITEMMRRMGMGPEEPVNHALVRRSLVDAMTKIEEKVKVPRDARSMREWFANHLDP